MARTKEIGLASAFATKDEAAARPRQGPERGSPPVAVAAAAPTVAPVPFAVPTPSATRPATTRRAIQARTPGAPPPAGTGAPVGVTLMLPPELYERLRRYCFEQRTTHRAVSAQAIDEYLAARGM